MTIAGATQDDLIAFDQQVNDLQAKINALSSENATLKDMLNKLKEEYAAIQKTLGKAVEAPTQQLPVGLPQKP